MSLAATANACSRKAQGFGATEAAIGPGDQRGASHAVDVGITLTAAPKATSTNARRETFTHRAD
jgi:hypothetical protein